MEYERIHKVQSGIISPSKLRMKLIGAPKKKDVSNSNSSRTSPSKLEANDFVKNSLLATNCGGFDDEVLSSEVTSLKLSGNVGVNANQGNQNHKMHQFSKSESVNSSSVHPMRPFEDENLDYDSNASSSSFEFHKGERSIHSQLVRSLSRPMSSKWNDAEKWIMNKQNAHSNYPKKSHLQSQPNRLTAMANMLRIAPESLGLDQKLSVKRVDFCLPNVEKPSFGQANEPNMGVDLCPQSEDFKEVENSGLSCATTCTENTTGTPAIRSVSMRDMGTEMTPIPSQEPSRTATPEGATTPLRSPTSSIPSTPRTTPNGQPFEFDLQNINGHSKKELSEHELKLKTKREIMALGVQLGKLNIAAWASEDEKEKRSCVSECIGDKKLERIEFEKRAAVWEEAEKTRHTARYKREEIKIQAWESQQKAKLEAEMRRIEAEVEQMKAHAQAKMVKKIAMSRQKSEEKRAAAEARRIRQEDKTTARTEYIRQTGRVPTSPFTCCGWLS